MSADIVEWLTSESKKSWQGVIAPKLREASAEIVRLRGEVNPWQHAVDQQRVIAHLGVAADGVSLEEAIKQLGELIDWHIDVATDPQVNGGYALVKQATATAMPNGVEGLAGVRDTLIVAANNPSSHGREIGLCRIMLEQASRIDAALRAADNRDAAGVDSEEDAYVIERMGKLLAEIAVIVNGPEPDMTRWSYHDLPEKVRALKATPAAVPAGEAVAVFTNDGTSEAQFIADGERLNCPRCGGSGHVDDCRQPADGEAVAIYQLADGEGGRLWQDTDKATFDWWQGRDRATRIVYTTPPAPVQAAPQEGEVLPRELAQWMRDRGILPDEPFTDADLIAALNNHEVELLAAHPSACELGAVREVINRRKGEAEKRPGEDGYTMGWSDGVAGFARELEAALQHRGDSRGGEGRS